MKEHMIVGKVAKSAGSIWIPALPRKRVVVIVALIHYHILAAVGDANRGGLSLLQRLRQHDSKVGVFILLLLHIIQSCALVGLHVAHAQRGVEIERNHRHAILLCAHLNRGNAGEKSASFDGDIEILARDRVGGVVFVAIGVLGGAVER